RSYNVWGKQRKVIWQEDSTTSVQLKAITNRGYTRHEEIEEVGLIHMNGRVYDQELGRFISADPIIQAPFVTNSFNRYTYVWNNPLKYVDPTGFELSQEQIDSVGGNSGKHSEDYGDSGNDYSQSDNGKDTSYDNGQNHDVSSEDVYGKNENGWIDGDQLAEDIVNGVVVPFVQASYTGIVYGPFGVTLDFAITPNYISYDIGLGLAFGAGSTISTGLMDSYGDGDLKTGKLDVTVQGGYKGRGGKWSVSNELNIEGDDYLGDNFSNSYGYTGYGSGFGGCICLNVSNGKYEYDKFSPDSIPSYEELAP
ncbi:RHS repeat-associated core domain-containing protein, partial [Enterovibrio calviensis]|uniref:RHS repeat-associated core domain-containing protein n=1 Tax=Enterovibrio calviensis TaxID=91359 RepID=UPI003736396D